MLVWWYDCSQRVNCNAQGAAVLNNLLNLFNPSPARLAFPLSTKFILPPSPQHLPHPTLPCTPSVTIVLKSPVTALGLMVLGCAVRMGWMWLCYLQMPWAFFLMVIWEEKALLKTWSQKTGFRQGQGLMLSALAWKWPLVLEANMRCKGAVFQRGMVLHVNYCRTVDTGRRPTKGRHSPHPTLTQNVSTHFQPCADRKSPRLSGCSYSYVFTSFLLFWAV